MDTNDSITPEAKRLQAAEYARKWREENRQRSRDYAAAWHKAHPGHQYRTQSRNKQITAALKMARKRAEERGFEFDEALFDLFAANPPTHCACCENEFEYGAERKDQTRDRSPSIDRVDNNKGYAIGNVAYICVHCNRTKSTRTLKEFVLMADYISRHIPIQG